MPEAKRTPIETESLTARSQRLGPSAIRLFFAIAERWNLSAAEQLKLLALPRSTLAKYRADPASARLSPDTLERVSYLVGIFKALEILLPRPEAADGWIRRPNLAPPFLGASALDRMLSGNVADLYVVRRYLDGERGW